ncbi:MAG: lipolytic protein family [Verrucomicrobia bacterium]|nr:lipolytic protein family [Verrucomicrobiota bacterium]
MTPTSGLAEAPNEPAPLPDLVALQQKLALLRTPLVWVFTGDSITQGARHLGRERSYPELVQERIRWELKRRRDLFINSGLSGENTAGLLADFDWRVLRLRPDVVSIMIGMNNATQGPAGVEKFESDLREMLARVRAAGAIPILHRTNPIDDASPDSRTRHDLPLYNESIARVAQATQTILVDHWHYWQAKKKEPAALREWLADPIHPNGAGHRQLAIEFFRTLGCYDARAASCQP